MLEFLKNRLVDGLTIKSVKERPSKYVITFEYGSDEVKMDLPKCCMPGCQCNVVDHTVYAVMAEMCIKREELAKAKEWLDKIIF